MFFMKENEEKSFIQTKKALLEKLEVISFILNGLITLKNLCKFVKNRLTMIFCNDIL